MSLIFSKIDFSLLKKALLKSSKILPEQRDSNEKKQEAVSRE